MQIEIQELKEEVKALRGQLQELIVLWKTATNILTMIKWIAGVGVAFTVLYNFFKGFHV